MWGKNDFFFNLPPIVEELAILYFNVDYEYSTIFPAQVIFYYLFLFEP